MDISKIFYKYYLVKIEKVKIGYTLYLLNIYFMLNCNLVRLMKSRVTECSRSINERQNSHVNICDMHTDILLT